MFVTNDLVIKMIQVQKLDLIHLFKQKEIDILVHGCNCFQTMGAGIARIISKEYPETLQADKKQSIYADKSKLGKFTFCTIDNQMIVNAYTQYHYGFGKDHFCYEKFPSLLDELFTKFHDKRIGMPLIGCGLAGGDMSVILEEIQKAVIRNNFNENQLFICEINKMMLQKANEILSNMN